MAQGATDNSVRALALARRKALSSGGKAGMGAQAASAPVRPSRSARPQAEAAPAAPAPAAAPARSSGRAAAPRRAAVQATASSTAREASLARRIAMSQRGKVAAKSSDRVRTPAEIRSSAAEAAAAAPTKKGDCGCGCGGKGDCGDKAKTEAQVSSRPQTSNKNRLRNSKRPAIVQSVSKAAALARRKAMSSRGKAGISAAGMSEAQTARAVNPQLSGRELAKALRESRSKRGSAGQKKSAPTGRRRKASDGVGPAKDQPWKVGASETSHGQTVTGTMVGRDKDMTGDESGSCHGVTGTEYLGADIFREFCEAEPQKAPLRVGETSTASGNTVTGNEVGRSTKVTGDEPGTCATITGSEYVSAEQGSAFCGSKPAPAMNHVTADNTRNNQRVTGNQVNRNAQVTGGEAGANRELTGSQYTNVSEASAPAKVGMTKTLSGGSVTGTTVGRKENMTGDEAGSCRAITGDEYIGEEQFTSFCSSKPAANDKKVGLSKTLGGERVSGTMTGRSLKVTGDEPGTCKAVTGTPYAGTEQYNTYCEAPVAKSARERVQPSKRAMGMPMTGIQPGVSGVTGAEKGACENVSGTPYIGADQVAACAAEAAEPNAPDFPQALESAPWDDFSVEPPSHASDNQARSAAVTGAMADGGNITGPFGMAGGKVTGTEDARFGNSDPSVAAPEVPETAPEVDGRVKSRITGEGQNAGLKITGDDWDRGDRVTGTEGASVMGRNQTRRGPSPMAAMGIRAAQQAEQPVPVSHVTGSSGNTDKGSLITYSGGARG